jgi:hypothetical protein
LLNLILRRYPDCLLAAEFSAMLSSLSQLLVDCKLVDVTCWLLRCLLAFAESMKCKDFGDLTGDVHQLWAKIYTSAYRFVL